MKCPLTISPIVKFYASNCLHHVKISVDPRDGSPSLPHGNWSDETTVSALLLNLQSLLSNPDLEEGCVCNVTAAHMLREAPMTYKQMALDCVTASLRVDGTIKISRKGKIPKSLVSSLLHCDFST